MVTGGIPQACRTRGVRHPLLRLLAVVECGTRAVLAAAFGPEDTGELGYAHTLADAGFDAVEFLRDISSSGAQFLVRSSARRCATPPDAPTWPAWATASYPPCCRFAFVQQLAWKK
jgi:hypothetical protein